MLITKQVAFLSCLMLKVLAWSKVKIDFLEISFNLTEGYIDADANATLSETDSAANIYFMIHKDLDIFVNMVIKYSANGSDNIELEFMNRTVGVCKFLQNIRYEPLLRIAYKLALENAHLPTQCPVKKDVLYYVLNFKVDTDRIPPIIPYSRISALFTFSAMENENLRRFAELKILAERKQLSKN